MNKLLLGLKKVLKDLNDLEIKYALVGGLAVSYHCLERATKDLDFSISVSDDTEAESVIRALIGTGYQQYQILDHKETGRLATARLYTFVGENNYEIICDLLFSSCGIEKEITESATVCEILPGISTPIARPAHLIAMKLVSFDPIRRPQDGQDIVELLKLIKEEEREEILQAIDKIQTLSCNRGKDLREVFKDFCRTT